MRASSDPAAVLAEIGPLEGRYLTPEEVGEALGFERAAIARRARKGEIPGARQFGRAWRFHAAPFRAWVRGWWEPADDPDFDAWMNDLRRSIVDS